jgi:hypothetical protein
VGNNAHSHSCSLFYSSPKALLFIGLQYFLCQFLFSEAREFRPGGELLRRAFSWLTLGNLSYARGDRLAAGSEFAHFFGGADEVRSEFEAAGFRVLELTLPAGGPRGGAVLRRDEV